MSSSGAKGRKATTSPLTAISLFNFQIHRILETPLDEHVTTFVGPTDGGKSAVLRALRHAALNDAAGALFLRHGDDELEVRVRLGRHTVRRVRGDKANEYFLDDKRFVAFGQGGVPEEITKLLNVSEVNFQDQHDPPFWLTDSPGQVAKNLNKIVNLDVIDRVAAAVAKELNTARVAVGICERRVERAEGELKVLAWVRQARADFSKLERIEQKALAAKEQAESLRQLLGAAMDCYRRRTQAKEAAVDAGAAADAGDRVAVVVAKRRELAGLISQASSLTHRLKAVPDFSPVEEARGVADAAAVGRRELAVMVADWEDLEAQRCRLERARGEKELELKNLGDVCPACGQRVSRTPSPSSVPTSTSRTARPRPSMSRVRTGTK